MNAAIASLVNGKNTAAVSAEDRGLLYGDGLFETFRIQNWKPCLWQQHLQRLGESAKALAIEFDPAVIETELASLLASVASQHQKLNGNAIGKIIITRGEGGRGYLPPPLNNSNSWGTANKQTSSTRIIQLFKFPQQQAEKFRQGITLGIAEFQLSQNKTLAGHKHLNRLEQVLVSQELQEQQVDEVLVSDSAGNIIEGSRSNLFFAYQNRLYTPDLSLSGVRGIMRQYLIEKFAADGVEIHRRHHDIEALASAEEIFFCNSVFGIWPVVKMQRDAKVAGAKKVPLVLGSYTRQALDYQDAILT